MTVGTPGFRYHEGIAPFGELEVLLPHNGGTPHHTMPAAIQVMSGSIARDAWVDSDWLRAELGGEACERQKAELYPAIMYTATFEAIHGFYLSDYCLAAAVRSGANDTRDFATLSANWLVPSSIVGCGTGKLDISGNLLARIYKRIRKPDEIYGKVCNINVRPELQGQKIGAALLHGVLSQLPEDKKATMYVARANGRLIDKLRELGYAETGSQPRDDLIEGVVLEEVRLEAPSVGDVKDRLSRKFRWLNDAETMLAA